MHKCYNTKNIPLLKKRSCAFWTGFLLLNQIMCVTFLFQTLHGFLFISEESTFYLGWQGFPEATPTPTPWGTDPTDLFVPWTCKLFPLCSLDLSAGTQPPHFYAMLKLVIQSVARMSSYSSLVFPSYLKLSSHSVK